MKNKIVLAGIVLCAALLAVSLSSCSSKLIAKNCEKAGNVDLYICDHP